MKKIIKILLVINIFFLIIPKSIWFNINSLWEINSSVIDKVWIINSEQKIVIEQKIQDIRNKYTAEILLVIIPSTDWEDISALWTEIWQKIWVWKSDKDNWIVVLIALNDRAWNISTGYWVEWVLPDLLANKLGQKNFALFKEEKYFDWINWLLFDLDKVLSWDESIISTQDDSKNWDFSFLLVINFFLALIISSIFFKPIAKNGEYKKLFKYFIFAYLLSLPLTIIAVWLVWILANIAIWFFGWIFGIFWNSWKWWGSWGFKWWWGSRWWFWGFSWGSFGGWWSSWKW